MKNGLFNLDPLDVVDSGAIAMRARASCYVTKILHKLYMLAGFKFGDFLPIHQIKTSPSFPLYGTVVQFIAKKLGTAWERCRVHASTC